MLADSVEQINFQINHSSPSAVLEKEEIPGIPEILPILALEDIVIFPGMIVPLAVEVPASVRLIDDAVAGDRLVGVVLQKNRDKPLPAWEDLYHVGCAIRILRMLKFPDGSVRILVQGLLRIQLIEPVEFKPYLKARCGVLIEKVETSLEVEALIRNVRDKFLEIAQLSPAVNEQFRVLVLNISHPGQLADTIAAHMHLKLEEKQQLLETLDVKVRLRALFSMLSREYELLQLGTKIREEAQTSLSKSQREHFLREQLKAIRKELGETQIENELDELKERIEAAKLPEEAYKAAIREWERLHQIHPASPEYAVSRNYLDWILSLPWTTSTVDRLDLHEAQRILDRDHYGLTKVKERLLEFLAVLQLKRDLRGPILCLVGPPGVGKTSLGRSISEALGRKFLRISLGGIHDEAEIRGFRRTYVGSMPGRIIQGLRRVGTNNPVFLLDELDKIHGGGPHGDPASALLEVLDPEQNNAFVDHYLDIPFDLSKILFIGTANWLDPIHPALRDRLEVIEIPSYTVGEKIEIARRHLLPKQLAEHGLSKDKVRILNATYRQIITNYTREAGVRQLVREIAAILRKVARKIVEGSVQRLPIIVRPSDLQDLLGAPPYSAEKREKITDSGIAIGLAWTPYGGELLFIEATKMPGKGRLHLTGSLGEVMKESAQTALSYLRSQGEELGIKIEDFDQWDVHIHVPAGATPKDGPSAGITILIALASLFSGLLVRSDIAMTGEISLRGRILPVGGIKEKLLAAYRARIYNVILPEANHNEWQEIPEEVRKTLKPYFVERIDQAIKLALLDNKSGRSKPTRNSNLYKNRSNKKK